MHRFANPNRFMRLSQRVVPWCAALTVVLLAAGLYMALFASPAGDPLAQRAALDTQHAPTPSTAAALRLLHGGIEIELRNRGVVVYLE